MSSGKWVYKKFHFGRFGIVLSIITCIVCAIFIFVCIYYENTIAIPVSTTSELNGMEKLYYDNRSLFSTLKEMCTIILSIIGTSLVLSLAFEVNNRNSAYTDFFEQDILSSPEFYKHIPSEDKMKILNNLENQEYFTGNVVMGEMYQSIRKRLKESTYTYPKYKYYMSYCKYDVKCVDKGNYFEKTVVRTMKFRAYEGETEEKELCLGKYKNKKAKISGLNPFEISNLRIDGKEIEVSKITTEDLQDSEDVLVAQANYTSKQQYTLKEPLKFNSENDTVVVVEYLSRTEKDDIHSTFRCSVPCKEFEVSFSIYGNYALIPIGFGFCDHAKLSPNSKNDSEATVHFNQWLFEDDGVVIILNPKPKSRKKSC